MKTLANSLLCAAALPLGVVSCSKGETPKKLPNVIVILADDLGYGDVSAYGATTISTPNIDFLSDNGGCFTDGYATSATSTPSRYALFTGVYPWKNPRAKILAGDAPLLISEDEFTMPKMLKSKGYATAAIGKWHLGMGNGSVNWNETITPGANQIGFDYSCLIAATNDRVPSVYVENGDVVGLDKSDPIEVNYKVNFEGEPTALTHPEMQKLTWHHGHNCSIVNGIPRMGYMRGGESAKWVDEDMADYFVGKVRNFISENRDNPFFLYYGLHQPHVPRAPHSRFVGKTTMGPRGDAIVEADWCVGEVINKLKSEGLLENTIIIFSSDNGPVLNDGYNDNSVELLGDHKPAGVQRGGKYSLFDAGTHVPFFIYWEGEIKPFKSSALVSQIDILASLAELVDAEIPQGLDSENHLNAFMGRTQQGRTNYIIEAMRCVAYRKGDYILIPPYKGDKYHVAGSELGRFDNYVLFDLSNDPSQQSDIAENNPVLTKQLIGEFREIVGDYTPPVFVNTVKVNNER